MRISQIVALQNAAAALAAPIRFIDRPERAATAVAFENAWVPFRNPVTVEPSVCVTEITFVPAAVVAMFSVSAPLAAHHV